MMTPQDIRDKTFEKAIFGGYDMDPDEIIKEYGADMLRLWAGSADYHVDVRCSNEIFKQLGQNYLKFRNTARYCLGNLAGFNADELVAPEDMLELDRWALTKLNALIREVEDAYYNYEFHVVSHAVNDFCVVELSSFYLDIIKDRLYCESKDGLKRRSAQTALFLVLDTLTKMFAPILAFTADEIWQAMAEAPRAQVSPAELKRAAMRASKSSFSPVVFIKLSFFHIRQRILPHQHLAHPSVVGLQHGDGYVGVFKLIAGSGKGVHHLDAPAAHGLAVEIEGVLVPLHQLQEVGYGHGAEQKKYNYKPGQSTAVIHKGCHAPMSLPGRLTGRNRMNKIKCSINRVYCQMQGTARHLFKRGTVLFREKERRPRMDTRSGLRNLSK